MARTTNQLISRLGSLLVLGVLLLNLALDVSAIDLKRSLSYAEGLGSLLKQGGGNQAAQNNYASDDSLMAAQGHSNKVSKALRFLHSKAGDVVYKRSKSMQNSAVGKNELARSSSSHDEFERHASAQPADNRSDDQVISDACKDHSTKTCNFAVKTALKQSPENRARLALALRRKPDHVDASKLLYHKLFESAIGKVEHEGLDSKIDAGLSLMINRTPYGFMANQALNMAAKKL